MYCTQAGHRMANFVQDLRDITNNLLFGQCVSEIEKLPDVAGFEAKRAGDGTRTRDTLLGRQALYH